ncbi:MAG: polysaccharide biosynthesis C-terminal domain-containing protein [Dehalococcoidia bacterium]|nr:polysaccharide biosynthesis C-terminal domain-containing protein [Dehalococcoidia bacterium]
MNKQPSSGASKFIRDTAWLAAAQIVSPFIGLITMPILTKTYSTDLYGIWVQVIITTGLLAPVLTMHLGTTYIRFMAAEQSKIKRRQAFSAMFWPILILSSLALIISLLMRQKLSTFVFADPDYSLFVPLTFFLTSIDALFSFSLCYWRAMRSIKRAAIMQIAFSIIRLAVIAALVPTGFALQWVILAIAILQGVFMMMILGLISREIGFPTPTFTGLKEYLSFSIPLLPAGMLLWVLSSSDRYFITHLLDISQTGIYSASYTLGSTLSYLISPITFNAFYAISGLWEQNKLASVRNYLEYSYKLFLTMAIPGAAGLYIISQPLLRILATSNYMIGGGIVLLVALGIILNGIYQINVFIVFMVKQTKWLPLVIAVAAITNIVLNLALIPSVGIMGAAISTMASYFVLATIVTIWSRRNLEYKLDIKFSAKVIIASILMALCLSFIEIDGALGIIIKVPAGIILYGLGLFLFKAFSKRDIELIKETITGLKSQIWPQKIDYNYISPEDTEELK